MKLRLLFACAVACALSVCVAGDFDDATPEPASKKHTAPAKHKPPAGGPRKAAAKEAAADNGAKAKPGAKEVAGKDAKKPGAKEAAGKDAKPQVVKDADGRIAPTEAEMAKAIKNKKPFYTKFAEGREVAWKCGLPLFVACVPSGTPVSQTFEGKILKHKAFIKEFVPQNAVLVIWRLKPGKVEEPPQQHRGRRRNNNGPRPQPTSIDVRPLKGMEIEFLKKYGPAKETAKFSDMSNYPTLICMDRSCRKMLFRMPKYQAKEGDTFGVWFSQVVDFYRASGFEPKLTPYGQKICENPQEPKKWK